MKRVRLASLLLTAGALAARAPVYGDAPSGGGGKAAAHWSFVPPVRPGPPRVRQANWPRNPIDRFILARLEAEGLTPAEEASRATLLRRLHLDLTGLPPEPEELAAFDTDTTPDAHERELDRLLASPHFGERWGRHWLDKARYADSDGYEKDNHRPDAWRYRDWVIGALNTDMPFDQFTLEQLAGDLLPGPSPVQKLATAFHRQTLTNTEGGADKEQFRVEAIFDRVETTSSVWLGLTVGCARCHDHKYDSIPQRDYYQLFAFFQNADEVTHDVPISDEAMAEYETKLAGYARSRRALEESLAARREDLERSLPAWEAEVQGKLREEAAEGIRFHPLEVVSIKPANEVTFQQLDDGSYLAGGADPAVESYVITARPPRNRITGLRLEVLADKSLPRGGPGRAGNGNFVLSELRAATGGVPVAFQEPSADFADKDWPVKGSVDGDPKTGWAISPEQGKDHHAVFPAREPIDLDSSAVLTITLDQQYGSQHTIGRLRVLAMTGTKPPLDLPDDVRQVLARDRAARSEADKSLLLRHYAALAPATAPLARAIEELKKQEPKAPLMTVRVLAEREKDRRPTHVLHRGDFLQPEAETTPRGLSALPPLAPRADGGPQDRLDLARWLLEPKNPLTARVTANQVWSILFGSGLVRTPDDFGVRGESPTHPELLDWLATEQARLGWSQKRFIRAIVTSAAYRQSSAHRRDVAGRDLLNRLLHRQNRLRIEAEVVRDLSLAASGLLSLKIGGPSVFPPMPAHIAALSYADNFKWQTSEGDDRHRRGMYTYFKRTAPHPTLITFDCPDSNTTCVQRRSSNTPLQALTALNNETSVEAARGLAARLLEGDGGDAERAALGFRVSTARWPEPEESARLLDVLRAARGWYRERADEALQLLGGKTPGGSPAAEAAAWTTVARVLLNLDEHITRG